MRRHIRRQRGRPDEPTTTRQGLAPCPLRGGSILRYRAAISFAASAIFAVTVATTTPEAATARASFAALPHWWINQALCIHRHESTDWHRTTDWLGRPSRDHGGMQIDVGTWSALAPRGFPGEPAVASREEQLVVAYRIWRANGHRFGGGQWPYSSVACGVD